jgi:hypothetical protein
MYGCQTANGRALSLHSMGRALPARKAGNLIATLNQMGLHGVLLEYCTFNTLLRIFVSSWGTGDSVLMRIKSRRGFPTIQFASRKVKLLPMLN